MPRYRVIVHRRVHKFLNGIQSKTRRLTILEAIESLENYPMSLRDMDVATIRGMNRTFRIRVGRYRIIFTVEKVENTIYVTHLDTRKRVYGKS